MAGAYITVVGAILCNISENCIRGDIVDGRSLGRRFEGFRVFRFHFGHFTEDAKVREVLQVERGNLLLSSSTLANLSKYSRALEPHCPIILRSIFPRGPIEGRG